ncbi:hypothetical protein AVEN_57194-1 [Araneus ventricosus]|uniref:Transposase Tc1-like domain-containing protein n=1 Tax=Araneus ventricosus TaxID=182803 RepID=A0A4Y2RBQ8_ARAVE|nr:hypothetical protein AVEN_57194-1 [Araneus ventricosus]
MNIAIEKNSQTVAGNLLVNKSDEICKLELLHLEVRQIAKRRWLLKEFNLTPSVVCNLWKQFQDTGPIDRKPGQGRPRATTATEDRYLSIIARHNRGATSSQLFRNLYAGTETRVSRATVSKRLHETGLFARRPAVCVPLISTNRRVRLAWCREHRDWSMDQ